MATTTTETIRVYADSSVYGGVFDDEFSRPSLVFFDRVREGRFRWVVSALVEEELEQSPSEVREWFAKFRVAADSVAVTDEAVALRQAYLDAGILTPKSSDDALHVALATVAQCGLIVRWNFRHIVHYRKIPRYNAVNVLHRRAILDIRSPLEVIEDES